MDALLILVFLTVFLSVFLFIIGLRDSRGRPWQVLQERVERLRHGQRPPEAAEKDSQAADHLRKRTYSDLPVLNLFLARSQRAEKAALELERAAIPLRVGEFYLIRYAMAVMFFLLPLIFNRGFIGIVFGVGLALVGFLLPAFYVASKRKGRLNRINAQMGEMLSLVSNSLKSGYGLMQSFEFAASQLRPPLAVELRRLIRDSGLGMSGEEALQALGKRIDSPDLDMVLTAINIQRSAGGNLAEVLDNVAFTMRERERIRGEIRTLTSQQRMTGIIIGGLPIGMALLFLLINPDYMGVLFTETAGRIMLAAAAGFEVVGILAMRQIMAIDV